MRVFTVAITIALSCAIFVHAQNLTILAEAFPSFPACALLPYYEALVAQSCLITDYYCQCITSIEEITLQASVKVVEACGTEVADFVDALGKLCETVDVPTATSRRPTIFRPVSIPSGVARPPTIPVRPPTIPVRPPTIPTRPPFIPTRFIISSSTLTSQLLSITDRSDSTSTILASEFPPTETTPASPIPSTTTVQPTSTTHSSDLPLPSDSALASSLGQSSAPGLPTGTKAGMGAGVAVGALVLSVTAFILCRRRRRKAPLLTVLDGPRPGSSEGFEKAELVGSEPKGWSSFRLARKPELEAESRRKTIGAEVGVAELDNQERAVVLVELDGHAKPPAERSQAEVPVIIDRSRAQTPFPEYIPLPPSPTNNPTPLLAGPVPSASDLFPTPQTTSAAIDEETDLEYQAYRLQAERKRLAEREEQITMEEEALRRKKALNSERGITDEATRLRGKLIGK